MPNHIVRPGEGLLSIAHDYGLAPATIWDDPANAQLRKRRPDPNILAPGDELFVRDKQRKTEQIATDQRHKFRCTGIPAMIRVQVIGRDPVLGGDRVLADQPFELDVEGVKHTGITDGDGVVEAPVSPRARRAVLVVGPPRASQRFEFSIGQLDPLDPDDPLVGVAGVQRRLNNLGYNCGPANGQLNELTESAIEGFRHRTGLPPGTDWQDSQFLDALTGFHDRVDTEPEPEPEPEPAGAG